MRLILLSLSALTILCVPAHANWVDDYFNNAVTTNPAAFKSQQRGYYTAGGFTSRVPYKAEPIMNISLPSISAGCGGIDMFWGGVSFMNAEYMVKKAEGILKNAPYVLFSLGIKALSSQFGDTMEAVQAIVDQLNSMQIDECAAAKGIIQIAKGEDSGLLNEFSRLKGNTEKLISGIDKNFTSASKKTANNPEEARKDAVNRKVTNPKLKELLTGKGYLLDKLVEDNRMTNDEASAIRALVGDVYLDNGKNQTATYKKGCAVVYKLDEYINVPTPYQRSASLATGTGICEHTATSIQQRAEKVLDNIFNSYLDQSFVLSAADHSFITQADIPVLSIMSSAAIEGEEYLQASKAMLSFITASSFTYGILNNLSISVSTVINEYSRQVKTEDMYTDVLLVALDNYYQAIRERMQAFESAYKIKLESFYTSFSLSISQRTLEDDLTLIKYDALKQMSSGR